MRTHQHVRAVYVDRLAINQEFINRLFINQLCAAMQVRWSYDYDTA